MSNRTRYFLVGSVLVLTAGLSIGLVAHYNGSLPLGRASVGPAELVYLPTSTNVVAFANVNQIMNSEFRQRLRQVLPTGQEKDRLLAEIGLDIEHDIDSVVAAFAGGEPAINGAMVLVRGKFNTPQMELLAVQHGARVEEYKGKRMILSEEIHSPHTGSSVPDAAKIVGERFTGCLAFLEPGLLAIGDAVAVRRAIDTSISHEDATKNTELMKFIADAEMGSNAWVVGRFDEMTKVAPLPSEVRDHLPAVQWFVVSAHVNSGVTGRVRADASDDETATKLRAAVNGVLATGQLMAGRDSRLDAILKSMQVSGTGKTVSMSFIVPLEVLDMVNGAAALKDLFDGKERAPRTISK